MKNISGLKPYTKENASEMGRKGGLASVKARQERKSLKEAFEVIMNQTLKTKDTGLLKLTTEPEIPIQNAILLSQVKKALEGDSYAYKMIIDTYKAFPEEKESLSVETICKYFYLTENNDERLNQGIYPFLSSVKDREELKEILSILKLMKELHIESNLDFSQSKIDKTFISGITDLKEKKLRAEEGRTGIQILDSEQEVKLAIQKLKEQQERQELDSKIEKAIDSLSMLDNMQLYQDILNDLPIDIENYIGLKEKDIFEETDFCFEIEEYNKTIEDIIIQDMEELEPYINEYVKTKENLPNFEILSVGTFLKAYEKMKTGYKVKTRLSLEELKEKYKG